MKVKAIIKKLAQTRKASEDMENTILLCSESGEKILLEVKIKS